MVVALTDHKWITGGTKKREKLENTSTLDERNRAETELRAAEAAIKHYREALQARDSFEKVESLASPRARLMTRQKQRPSAAFDTFPFTKMV